MHSVWKQDIKPLLPGPLQATPNYRMLTFEWHLIDTDNLTLCKSWIHRYDFASHDISNSGNHGKILPWPVNFYTYNLLLTVMFL